MKERDVLSMYRTLRIWELSIISEKYIGDYVRSIYKYMFDKLWFFL